MLTSISTSSFNIRVGFREKQNMDAESINSDGECEMDCRNLQNIENGNNLLSLDVKSIQSKVKSNFAKRKCIFSV